MATSKLLTRRSLLIGGGAALAAPVIIPYANLMPVKAFEHPHNLMRIMGPLRGIAMWGDGSFVEYEANLGATLREDVYRVVRYGGAPEEIAKKWLRGCNIVWPEDNPFGEEYDQAH